MNITSNKAFDSLEDTTLSLWEQGLKVTHWPHHRSQTNDYRPLLLPPYQFAKTSHWAQLKTPGLKHLVSETPDSSDDEVIAELVSFVEYLDSSKRKARFRINTMTEKFKEHVRGHTIAQAALLCPSTLQLSIVIDALMRLRSDYAAANYYPQLRGLENHQPICIDPSKAVCLDFHASNDGTDRQWNFEMASNSLYGQSSRTLHVSGAITFHSLDDVQLQRDLHVTSICRITSGVKSFLRILMRPMSFKAGTYTAPFQKLLIMENHTVAC